MCNYKMGVTLDPVKYCQNVFMVRDHITISSFGIKENVIYMI